MEKGRDGKYDAPILVHRSTKEAGIGVGVGSLLNVLLDLGFATICMLVFFFFSGPIVGLFTHEERTVSLGAIFLQGRCLWSPWFEFI